jgi:hypothetical protein
MRSHGRFAAFLRPAVLAWLPWAYAILAVFSSIAAPMLDFDDPLALVHGALVQQGAVPAIDFRSFYPPLGPFITAALFNLFGRTVIASRLFAGGIYFLVLFLLYRLLVRCFHGHAIRRILTFLLLTVALGRSITLPSWPAFGLALAALLIYFLSRRAPHFGWLLLALSGTLTSLAVLYRINFGGYVALVAGADLMIGCWQIGEKEDWVRRWKQLLLAAAIFFISMLAGFLGLGYGIYGNRMVAAVSEFTVTAQRLMLERGFIALTPSLRLAAILVFPAAWFTVRVLADRGKLSWRILPGLLVGVCVLLLSVAGAEHVQIVAIIMLCQIAGVIGLHFLGFPLTRLELAFLIFYNLQLHYYLSRADVWHWKFLPFAALLVPCLWLAELYRREPRDSGIFKRMDLAGCAVLVATVLITPLPHVRGGITLLSDMLLHLPFADSDHVLALIPRGSSWATIYDNVNELRAVQYLQQVTASTDPIFVGVQDHSKIFYNNLRIYWLSGRPIGAREFQLETRIATEAPVQREIIRDLDRNHVQCVVIDRDQPRGDETFARRAYSGSMLLDNFILTNFKEEAHFGQYAILRRDLP